TVETILHQIQKLIERFDGFAGRVGTQHCCLQGYLRRAGLFGAQQEVGPEKSGEVEDGQERCQFFLLTSPPATVDLPRIEFIKLKQGPGEFQQVAEWNAAGSVRVGGQI